MLGDGGVEVCGKIWFSNVTVQSGWCITADSEDDDEMFREVEARGLGDIPAVVFNPKVVMPTVRIYRKGIGNDEKVERIEIADVDIDIGEIRRTVDWVASKQLATPEVQTPGVSMWKNAPEFWASTRAEGIAQLQLKTALAVRFFQCEVRQEQSGRAGRTDLEIVQQRGDGTIVVPAEIEVKVLRERTSKGRPCSNARTERWICRGVRQAAAYRDDRGALCGMLCCFDMRRVDRGDQTTFGGVRAYADRLEVVLHRNFLYNSPEAWRKAHYPA